MSDERGMRWGSNSCVEDSSHRSAWDRGVAFHIPWDNNLHSGVRGRQVIVLGIGQSLADCL